MYEVDICQECNVPKTFNQLVTWLNNGDIVQKLNSRARLGFVECENLDPVFMNIGEIIGVSIEHLIVNITARAMELALKKLMPPEIPETIQSGRIGYLPLVESIYTVGQIMGYGKYEWMGYRFEDDADDYTRQRITEPFSVPMATGSYAGALSASVGGEHAVTYEKISPEVYEFTSRWTKYPAVLKEKLQLPDYQHREGDIELELCGTCGGPKALADFQWYPERGIISHRQTGRRMALLGSELLDLIFEALETELDESIPGIVVEAQRRFVKTGFYSIDMLEAEEDLRTQLALRGLGNLKSLKMDKKGVHLHLDNACMHLLVAGMVQGNFELAFDIDSDIEWEFSEQGDLELSVTPKKF